MTLSMNKKQLCRSEYAPLQTVIVCEPTYMEISEVINETQRHYADRNIDIELALKQHDMFVSALEKEGIEVIKLPPQKKYPEQVFTRDIGFTLGSQIFVSQMGHGLRQGEENILIDWLKKEGRAYHNLKEHSIEGGDVLIDGDTVFVGVSGRTCKDAIFYLQQLLPIHKVVPIPIEESYLHLDCVFNILSSEEALVYSEAISQKEREILASHYQLIEVEKEEQFTLGTNVLSIGNKKVLSLPVNKKVNRELRNRGYDVIEVDLSEIIKSGGSFRCCTMPIYRDSI
ncbi:dimethylarginine dimethylaminohydrolase family protein [Metabacillus iocasae]|uniref:N-dimethylarginine dimethylaminohydrolase n=1 Tax=Priestia iocasae TaxID=2291674 RepID=A0ABS2QXM7_9BACI|nr:dimethylarginine dimethylaminohydrolase family protein [Metabacillus iocasae]MBM7703707.1 N-dimethylarginine dimethylaminohydrolase [Metabacillus iocasae]